MPKVCLTGELLRAGTHRLEVRLGLELVDSGFYFSVLSDFRPRLATGATESLVFFDPADCTPCEVHASCTRAKHLPRSLRLGRQADHMALQAARARQQTAAFLDTDRRRAGIEGTISQGVRCLGLRRARYLDPSLGRMLSADSVQPNSPGSHVHNRYVYVANNPATWTDPSGHQIAANPPKGGNEYATLLALSILAIAALTTLLEAINTTILSVVCYLTLECVDILNDV